jgi:hypothetical protein
MTGMVLGLHRVWRRMPELTGHRLEDIEQHLQDGTFKPADVLKA